MVKVRWCLVPALALMLAVSSTHASEPGGEPTGIGPVFGSQTSSGFKIRTSVLDGPELQGIGGRPLLYDNTGRCTVKTSWLAVGADTDSSAKLNIRDWFTTNGGGVAGFEVFVVNPDTNRDQRVVNMEFRDGTDASNQGIEFGPRKLFNPTALTRVPSNSANPEWPLRLTVDYINETYAIAEGILNENTGEFEWTELSSVSLGNRTGFDLPPGKIGFNFRHAIEDSICDLPPGDPVFGPVMANGGPGTADGVYIINADKACTQNQRNALPCPGNSGFDGAEPCQGGDDCNLQRAFYGIALTIFAGAGPDERGDGNNEIATAQNIPRPNVGSGDIETISGFLGDNDQSYSGVPVTCFDQDDDGEVTVLDWGGLQDCFGDDILDECRLYDCDGDGNVRIEDYEAFQIASEGGDPGCDCAIPDPPVLLQDVDVYEVASLSTDQVLSVLLEGAKSPIDGPLWDPFLRIFADTGAGIEQLSNIDGGVSDDYERLSLDAFTTVVVPANLVGGKMYIGVSAASNQGYDPEDPTNYPIIDAEDAGGYTLSIAMTDPASVQDDESGGNFDCYETKHEPDDTMADAIALGTPNTNNPVKAMIGDGAFGPLGQDTDIYMVDLAEINPNAKSLRVVFDAPPTPGTFRTVFDLAVGLYDEDGDLIACSDQVARWGPLDFDFTPPSFNQNIVFDPQDPKTYFVAVFGTDRVWHDANGNDIHPAVPPTILNFPHGPGVAGTQSSFLFPTVGGRVNKPGAPLQGPDPDDPANSILFRQCYSFFIIDETAVVSCPNNNQDCDPDEIASPSGNDSIPLATGGLPIQTMLGAPLDESPVPRRSLGNGPFGANQGDNDFFSISVTPGEIIAFHVADTQQPPIQDNWNRSYVTFFDVNGNLIADQDYSLEIANSTAFLNFTDALAATVVTTVPQGITTMYANIGIDAGNLLRRENSPFDAARAGTALINRFDLGSQNARRYRVAVSRRERAAALPDDIRMFVVPQRGFDEGHISPTDGNNNTTPFSSSFPDLLELNPNTGGTLQALPGGVSFNTFQTFLGGFRSTDPIIAYDGERLWLSVDALDTEQFQFMDHELFWIDPDTGVVNGLGDLLGFGLRSFLTGMVEIDGSLYLLESHEFILNDFPNTANLDNLLSWEKEDEFGDPVRNPVITTTALSAPSDEFDNLDGDLGTDGTFIYVDCFKDGLSVGICYFQTDGTYVDMIPNHVSNVNLIPGPRLGGFDIVHDGDRGLDVVFATDANGLLVEMADLSDGSSLGGYEMPRDFQVVRLTMAPDLP